MVKEKEKLKELSRIHLRSFPLIHWGEGGGGGSKMSVPLHALAINIVVTVN